MKKNWERAAMRFASVHYLDRQGMLEVTFENGDRFLLAAESVLPSASRVPLPPPDWARIRIAEPRDVLEVPTHDSAIEIPWDRIRSLADPEFRAFLADRAEERAQRIGERIQMLRREAGLSRAALAGKLGIPREAVANLEAGRINPSIDLLENVARVLERHLRDFVAE